MLHRLELSDRPAELGAGFGVLHRKLKQALHAAHHFRHQAHGRDGKRVVDGGFSLGTPGQQSAFGNRHGIEHHLIQFARGIDGGRGTPGNSGCVGGKKKQSQLAIQTGRADQKIGHSGIGHECLTACKSMNSMDIGVCVQVDVAVFPGRVFLQERQRPLSFPGHQIGQLASFLQIATGVLQQAGAQESG